MESRSEPRSYIRRETAQFFGVDEKSEALEKQRWLDRRRRMASRKYGALVAEHRPPDPDITRDVPDTTETPEVSALRPRDTCDSNMLTRSMITANNSWSMTLQPRDTELADYIWDDFFVFTQGVTLRRWQQPVRRKDSVARMTLSGLHYIVEVSLWNILNPLIRCFEDIMTLKQYFLTRMINGHPWIANF